MPEREFFFSTWEEVLPMGKKRPALADLKYCVHDQAVYMCFRWADSASRVHSFDGTLRFSESFKDKDVTQVVIAHISVEGDVNEIDLGTLVVLQQASGKTVAELVSALEGLGFDVKVSKY